MRTSLNELKQLEDFMLKKSSGEERLLLSAKFILDPGLLEKLRWQERTYELIKEYGRQKLRKEIENVHRKLFYEEEHSGFKQKILKLFSKR